MQSHEDTLLLDVEISPVANSWTLLASRSNPSPALFASLRSNRSKNQQSHVANSLRARAWASYRPRDSRAQKLATAVQSSRRCLSACCWSPRPWRGFVTISSGPSPLASA